MFNFMHPKPVVSRKPVAEMTIKQAARQPINADTVQQALTIACLQKSVLNGVVASNPTLSARRL